MSYLELPKKTFRVYQGDCLALLQRMPEQSIDMILCDLPYGMTNCKWDSVLPLEELWKLYNRVAKERAAIVLTSSQPFTSNLVMSNIKHFRYEWIWEKAVVSNFQLSKKMPLKVHEEICVFYRAAPTYNPQNLVRLETPRKSNNKSRVESKLGHFHTWNANYLSEWAEYPSSIIRFKVEKRGLHPTQKPIMLMQYLIRTYTKEGDLVLDNCMGSGTTGIAALTTGRRFVGMELDEKYYSMARKQLTKLRNWGALPESKA